MAGSRQAVVFCRLWCSARLRGRGAGGRPPWYQPPTPPAEPAGLAGAGFTSEAGPGARQRRDLGPRERTLWRLLYETAARAGEVLALDVDELDLRNRCAKAAVLEYVRVR